MKRGILLLCVLLKVTFTLFSQDVNIPDANFLSALIAEGVDTNEDGQISYAEAEAIISLNVSDKSIREMTGIEAFTNLDSLSCNRNSLLSLDVSGNIALTYLDCVYNYNLTSIDLSGNIALKELTCFDCNLTDLDVSNCIALEALYCAKNELVSLDVSKCEQLKLLYCTLNKIDTIDLSKNLKLDDLYCNSNQLSHLDVSNNKALKFLKCRRNNFTELDVSNNKALLELWCGSNQISNLDVSENISLEYIECIETPITSLDVSNNTALINLFCNLTPITQLDLSNNTSIRSLNIQEMPSLFEVCVWTMPFPPDGVYVYSTDSPNFYFKDCVSPELIINDTVLYQPDSVVAVSNEDGIIYLVPQNTEKDLSSIRSVSLDSVSNTANIPAKLSLTGLENGQYWLFARDSTGNISEYESITILGVGVDKNNVGQINLYPNPTENILTIRTDSPGQYSIEITSLNGQQILIEEMDGNSNQIDLTSYQMGVYFITVRSKYSVTTRKIIKL